MLWKKERRSHSIKVLILKKAYSFFKLSKPRILFATYLLFLIPYLTASHPNEFSNPMRLAILSLLAITTSMAFNSANSYFDRDIDSIMQRTRKRPLPSGTLTVKEAQAFVASSFTASALIAAYVSLIYGPIILALYCLAALSYIGIYTLFLKRRTALNVITLSPAVAVPILVGWYLGCGCLSLQSILMGIAATTWGPLHLWALASVYTQDYIRARVPMLPTVLNLKDVGKIMFTLALALSAITLSIALIKAHKLIYLLITIPATTALLRFSYKTLKEPGSKWSFKLYKFSSYYLPIILFSAYLNTIIPL
ncbi:MAG: hypothetical protein DRJ31_01605 [Candidatus Methanomethylicota archaeon]|uniref:Protoheme IX farnesyltransferase n=1 Tax=Thermoproteota archaeon TaxID=2056631 RepID=A0A497ESP3_9CREN|nr:MAG: hypothetical protein DRJ31_01605 [Candidatus Verstraetearchaeota archaeon]RLE53592.1 MAG: hypothetical protein DRJ33_00615 [Candidatus Verstraetearchaeota archaeon]